LQNVEIPAEKLEAIKPADIVITYIFHPDLTLEPIDQVHGKLTGS